MANTMIESSIVRLITFYLPQFHPIPENDKWWGKGFTEWTNVAKAKPLFRGHYQPHIPADLGFYDLRLPKARDAQADLAREYGIYGFCYYHYWFNGQRLLEYPFNEVLASGKPDFPFCICWANESWTRAWDGRSRVFLIEQKYSDDDDQKHIRWLSKAMSDKRYIRVNGKPIILIYRATRLPNPQKTVSIWREEAYKLGVGEIFLCKVESFSNEHIDPADYGFDAAVEFQPDWSQLGTPFRKGRFWELVSRLKISSAAYQNHRIYDYSEVVKNMLRKAGPSYKRFPCVTPSWDNSARKKNDGVILINSTPETYNAWLRAVIKKVSARNVNENEKIVFINAWNEWGEGNHLEPCCKWGKAYLEATRDALDIF